MRRPPPKRDAECDHCQKMARLLIPVGYAPGFPVIVWAYLCWQCRVNQDTRPDKWSTPGGWMRFHRDPDIRAAYDKWLEVTI